MTATRRALNRDWQTALNRLLLLPTYFEFSKYGRVSPVYIRMHVPTYTVKTFPLKGQSIDPSIDRISTGIFPNSPPFAAFFLSFFLSFCRLIRTESSRAAFSRREGDLRRERGDDCGKSDDGVRERGKRFWFSLERSRARNVPRSLATKR